MHKFLVTNHNVASSSNGYSQEYFLHTGVVLGIIAILSVPEIGRVKAIKALREMHFVHGSTLGLYDAKQIVDFLAENAKLDKGNLVISPPRQTVEWLGEGY